MVAWRRGNSAGRRNFGFAKVKLCAWADCNSNLLCQFRANRVKIGTVQCELRVLTIKKKTPGRNHVHKHDINLTWWECKVYPNLLKRTNSIALNHSPYFLKLSKRNGTNHFIFQPEFPVFQCKCKCPKKSVLSKFQPVGHRPMPKGPLQTSSFTCAEFKAPCKRTQHCWATNPNIVGCYMLRPFAEPVECCCMLLGVVAQSLIPVKL